MGGWVGELHGSQIQSSPSFIRRLGKETGRQKSFQAPLCLHKMTTQKIHNTVETEKTFPTPKHFPHIVSVFITFSGKEHQVKKNGHVAPLFQTDASR